MTHRYPKEGESFADYYPDKISIWGVKNTLTPFDYCKSSGEKIWWICPKGHEDYLSSIYHVGSGTGCPECGKLRKAVSRTIPPLEKSLGHLYPALIEEWSEKNDCSPFEVYSGSNKKYLWACSKGHEDFKAGVSSRVRGTGCPECGIEKQKISRSTPPYSKSLGYLYPELVKEWSLSNTRSPYEVYPKTHSEKFYWICPNGHADYLAYCSKRTMRGDGCPKCGDIKCGVNKSLPKIKDSLGYLYPELILEWSDKNDKTPYEVYPKADYLSVWVCCKCYTEWNTYCYSRTSNNPSGCPKCCNRISDIENNLRSSLIPYGALPDPNYKISKWTVDIYIPGKKVVVEYDGSRWHHTGESYERDKRKSLELLEMGYKVVRVREISTGYKLDSLNIQDPFYSEIFYENGLNSPYRKEPTEKLVENIRRLINND